MSENTQNEAPEVTPETPATEGGSATTRKRIKLPDFIVGLIQIAESVAFGIAKFKYKNEEKK